MNAFEVTAIGDASWLANNTGHDESEFISECCTICEASSLSRWVQFGEYMCEECYNTTPEDDDSEDLPF